MPNPAPTNLNGTNPSGLDIDLTWTAPPVVPAPLLLLHFDGTNGQTTTVDSSPAANTVTMNSGVTLTTSSPKFGTASMVQPGGNYLASFACKVPFTALAPLDIFATPAWTIECFFQMTAVGSFGQDSIIFAYGDSGATGIMSCLFAAVVSFADGATGQLQVTDNSAFSTNASQVFAIALVPGTWYHLALVQNGGATYIYWNGIVQGTNVSTWNPSTYAGYRGSENVCIGSFSDLSGGTVPSQVDEFRVSDFAVYTANFTPPVAPFPNGGTSVLGYDVYRNNLSIAAYLGSPPAAAYNDVAPIPGTYTYNVATWNGTVDDSPLSLPFTITVGGIEGTTPNFLNDELIFGAYFGGLLDLVEFVYLPERTPFLEGATNLIINRYKQEPQDNRQRGVDYTFFLVPGETIQTIAVTGISAQGVPQASTSPLVTPLVVSNLLLDPSGLKFAYSVSGGQNGVEYTVAFTTTTQIQTATVEEIFSINILVEDSFP